ncbi:MAG: hypothetical protein NC483_06960 [Ruminococcus sp.]|nr:hypothetical protein [Ruminococcus sp.]
MNCNISHLNKNEGVPYWCSSHKSLALSDNGKLPLTCTCKYKEKYEKIISYNKNDIRSIKLVYQMDKSIIPELYINGKLFDGILKLNNSIIDHKDYGGIMLSRLNNAQLVASSCPKCDGYHSDNGKFAYTPHKKHLCVYCGRFYKVDKPNIGNELALYFDFPDIILNKDTIKIDKEIEIIYDMLAGSLKVNGKSGSKLIINNEEINLVKYLNKILENEY